MWFFRKKSDPEAAQSAPKGQRRKAASPNKLFSWRKFLKFVLLIAVFGGLIYASFAGFSLLREKIKIEGKSIFAQPVRRIEFHSDGTLNGEWARPYLIFPKRTDIMEVDIFAIKRKIETCSQVKSVRVERHFPDTVRIDVSERIPLLRVRVSDGKIYREMFIDEEGEVFLCEKVAEIERKMMPFLAGTTLKKKADGHYEKIESLGKVCEFLKLAKAKYWPIYAQMEVISIEKLRKKNVPWSKINVRCHQIFSVIFKDSDFDEQLKRLNFILSTPQVKNKLPIERIDLSFGKDALINFGKYIEYFRETIYIGFYFEFSNCYP
jgi:cell division septal protein FtsQ